MSSHCICLDLGKQLLCRLDLEERAVEVHGGVVEAGADVDAEHVVEVAEHVPEARDLCAHLRLDLHRALQLEGRTPYSLKCDAHSGKMRTSPLVLKR